MLLWFTFLEFLLIAFGIEVAAGVGGVYLVNQIDLAVTLAKLVLGVHKDESFLGGNLGAEVEEGTGIFLHHLVVFLAHNALCDDFFLRDVLVVTLVCLGGGGDDGLRELLVLTHSLGQSDATKSAVASLVLTPCRTGQVATDNHFHTEAFALQAHGHHRVGSGEFPVGDDVCRCVEELGCNLVEHLTLERDAFGQHHVECRDAVGSDHHHKVVVDVVHVTDFAVIHFLLSGEVEISPC